MPDQIRTGRARGLKVAGVAAGVALAVAFTVSYVGGWLVREPGAVTAGTPARLTLQTVATLGYGSNPDWVSYLSRNGRGEWKRNTTLRVPANSVVTVTIYQYDTATGLRNPFWGRVRGTAGGTMKVNGKVASEVDPTQPGHTFAIPELGVSIPLPGVADAAPNQCSKAPCSTAQAHNTVTFSFRTGKAGQYRWQCFVPCAAGSIYGNGGPMQTEGYMDGMLEVG
jgi:hypothetical protein